MKNVAFGIAIGVICTIAFGALVVVLDDERVYRVSSVKDDHTVVLTCQDEAGQCYR